MQLLKNFDFHFTIFIKIEIFLDINFKSPMEYVPNFDKKNLLSASGLNAKLFGPLRMFPSAPDNYGAESCSLLCLPCQPPVLAIASSSGGVVYHSVLLQKHTMDSSDAADLDDAQSVSFYIKNQVPI